MKGSVAELEGIMMLDGSVSSSLSACPNVSPNCACAIWECAHKFHAASGASVDAAESLVQLFGPGKTLPEYLKHESYAILKEHVKVFLLDH